MIYAYECPSCAKAGREHLFDVWKSFKDASRRETCGVCRKVLRRVFTVPVAQTFTPFFDPTYKRQITSRRQDERLMKAHGHIDAHDIYRKKYKEQIKRAKWKKDRGLTGAPVQEVAKRLA